MRYCRNCQKSVANPTWWYCDRLDCRRERNKNSRTKHKEKRDEVHHKGIS